MAANETKAGLGEASRQLRMAAEAKKCWPCGCLHDSLTAIEGAIRAEERPAELAGSMEDARRRLEEVRYACLGCDVCYPALAINALSEVGIDTREACASAPVVKRDGWPPLPGSYNVLRYQAPVAICTLTNGKLRAAVASAAPAGVAIVGTAQTENLGIERVITNTIANPNIRYLILCGEDTRQAIGHLPGGSMLALAESGIDDRFRITGAPGRRPRLRNVSREAVEHFRRTVKMIDLVGTTDLEPILDAVRSCVERHPGPAEPFADERAVEPIRGWLPKTMTSDPAGYFVVYVDGTRGSVALEHFQTNGVLDAVIEGRTAAELYIAAIDRRLVSRLDHAAYLGRELARAEEALRSGRDYVQEGAPEQGAGTADAGCGCSSTCGG